MDVPAALPVLLQERPKQAAVLEAIGDSWVKMTPPGSPLLLEFHQPDGRFSVSDIEQLLTSLQQKVSESLVLTAVFYGTPHLRPQAVLVLELSADEGTISQLVHSDEQLSALQVGQAALEQVHTEHERLWFRVRQPPKLPSAVNLAVILTGMVLMLVMVAIAIPNFVNMGVRAKRAEIPANVDGIKTAQLAYDASFERFISQPEFVPMEMVGKGVREWPSGTAFDTLGWAPDGRVRGSYKLDVPGCQSDSCRASDFRVVGISDTDGDGELATYTAQKSVNAVLLTPNSVQ